MNAQASTSKQTELSQAIKRRFWLQHGCWYCLRAGVHRDWCKFAGTKGHVTSPNLKLEDTS